MASESEEQPPARAEDSTSDEPSARAEEDATEEEATSSDSASNSDSACEAAVRTQIVAEQRSDASAPNAQQEGVENMRAAMEEQETVGRKGTRSHMSYPQKPSYDYMDGRDVGRSLLRYKLLSAEATATPPPRSPVLSPTQRLTPMPFKRQRDE